MVTLNGRDVGDVVAGMRSIALGLVTTAVRTSHLSNRAGRPEAQLNAQIATNRSGKSGLDQVEEWYADLRESDRMSFPVTILALAAEID